MTTTPESSSSNSQSGRTSDFEVGLAAFKEAEYATAIVLLEPALSESLKNPLIARAQMALVISYEKMGEAERAAELCQFLKVQGTPQIQDWATRTLTSLVKRHPELARFQSTAEPPVVKPVEVTSPEADTTGFTPLEATSLPPNTDQLWVKPLAPEAPPTHATAPAVQPLEPVPASTPRSVASSLETGFQVAQSTFESPSLYQPRWRQAGRAQQWKSLGKVKLPQLVLTQIVTAIALYFAVQQTFYWISASYGNAIIKTLPRLGFRIVQPGAPLWTESFTVVSLLILIGGSRWILDALLRILHGLKPLSMQELSVYSPETAASLSRFCRKVNIPVPILGLLPTTTPVIFSYGVLPHVSRTVISQGLLDQLADDEIAALYANEVGHLSHWTVPLMSGMTTLLQLPYTLYWLTAEWANQKESPITKASATVITVMSYGFFWLWRWVPLWLSRQRTYYSDRIATDLTGNPNGYTRALLKLAIATANDVQHQGQASYLLEGFEILSPLGYRIAAPIGSLYPHAPLEQILEWERTNPLRHWLAINNTHPPTGERLNLLTLYARHWRLETELDWPEPTARRGRKTALTGAEWRSLWLQGAPYFGLVFGIAIALVLKVLGWIGMRTNWELVSWMGTDTTILVGLPLVGLCIGILIRLNPFFPDLQVQGRKSGYQEGLPSLLSNASAIPLNSQTVRLEGTLIGRRGISNVFNQDLWLKTSRGLIQLHYTSRYGIFSSLFPAVIRPSTLVNSALFVTGWFRRGVTPWVDVETLQTKNGKLERSYHPIWSLLIAAISATWGILALFNFKF